MLLRGERATIVSMNETITPNLYDVNNDELNGIAFETAHNELAQQRSLEMSLTDTNLYGAQQDADILKDYYGDNLEKVDLLGALSDPNSGALASEQLNAYNLSAETITLEGVKAAIKQAEVMAFMQSQREAAEKRFVLDILDREEAASNEESASQIQIKPKAEEDDSVRITTKKKKDSQKTFSLAA